jgi:predicted RNase H-like nuclease (RuvC/YqgF family)
MKPMRRNGYDLISTAPATIKLSFQLLVQLQDNEQLLNNYVTENDSLISALSSAESRLNEFYAEQSRWELELAQRLDIIEKLREQVREIEREKRDLQRRYNEQVWSDPFSFNQLSNVTPLDCNIRSRKASILR